MRKDYAFMLKPIRQIPSYAVILRCCWCRGEEQAEALEELDRRRLWLTEDQKVQAGLACRLPK